MHSPYIQVLLHETFQEYALTHLYASMNCKAIRNKFIITIHMPDKVWTLQITFTDKKFSYDFSAANIYTLPLYLLLMSRCRLLWCTASLSITNSNSLTTSLQIRRNLITLRLHNTIHMICRDIPLDSHSVAHSQPSVH